MIYDIVRVENIIQSTSALDYWITISSRYCKIQSFYYNKGCDKRGNINTAKLLYAMLFFFS